MVAGRRVLDFAAGCGIAAIACALAGAATVEAGEIEPLAGVAIHLNAALNGVRIVKLSCHGLKIGRTKHRHMVHGIPGEARLKEPNVKLFFLRMLRVDVV